MSASPLRLAGYVALPAHQGNGGFDHADPAADSDPAERSRPKHRADRGAGEELVHDARADPFEDHRDLGIRPDAAAHERDKARALTADVIEVRVDRDVRPLAGR
jgi:hypothetical protein